MPSAPSTADFVVERDPAPTEEAGYAAPVRMRQWMGGRILQSRPFGLGWGTIAIFAIVAIANAFLLVESVAFVLVWPFPVFDWYLLEEAHSRVGTGLVYAWSAPAYSDGGFEYVYRYSPLLPYVMTPFLTAGLLVWRLAHIAALLALPRRVALLALLAGPFWFDVAHGNFLTFAFVLAWHALDRKRWAMAGFFALALLIPRPLMVPVAAYLVWRYPESRLPAVIVTGAVLLLTAATGELLPWLEAMARGTDVIDTKFNWGPSRIVGIWWIPIGVVLGALLTLKGRLGIASLAMSPYVVPYYLIMGLLEIRGRPVASRVAVPVQLPGTVALPVRDTAPVSVAVPRGLAEPKLDGTLAPLNPPRRAVRQAHSEQGMTSSTETSS